MTHDELARSLAAHLRSPARMVWEDLQLGQSGSARPDVYTIEKSFVRPRPMAYEVKVARPDFLADVTAGKWLKYLEYAQGVVFAGEAGLLHLAEIPAGCGLIVRYESGCWKTRRRAILQACRVPESAWLKLLIDGVDRIRSSEWRARAFSEYSTAEKLRRRYGDEVADVLNDLDRARLSAKSIERQSEALLEHARLSAQRCEQGAEDRVRVLFDGIRTALDLPQGCSEWDIGVAVRRARRALSESAAVQDLRRELESIRTDVAARVERALGGET